MAIADPFGLLRVIFYYNLRYSLTPTSNKTSTNYYKCLCFYILAKSYRNCWDLTSKCLPDASSASSPPNAPQVPPKRFSNTSQINSNWLSNDSQMTPKSIPDASQRAPRCSPDVSSMLPPQSSPLTFRMSPRVLPRFHLWFGQCDEKITRKIK